MFLPLIYMLDNRCNTIKRGIAMKFLGLILVAFLCFNNRATNAAMPQYEDDEEFSHCLKITNDLDACVQEENKRVLNKVKQDYKNILGNTKLMSWNGSFDANTAVMRDMYESWTAYRNRLCSLSQAASVNVEPIVTEKYSCGLYHTWHHLDHLDKIIKLMKYSGDVQNNDFDLFKVYEHDDKYKICREDEKKSKNECLSGELDRATRRVKDLYSSLIHDENVGQWNNGPNLQNGNYRDMFDSWIAYRNRLCSLAAWAYGSAKIQPKVGVDECILFLTDEHRQILENVLFLAHSSLDEGFEDELGGGFVEPITNDGGLEEGQTITPLQRRIEGNTSL